MNDKAHAVSKVATPALDKMLAVKAQSQTIGEFLDWLAAQRLVLASYRGDRLLPAQGCEPEALLARYFEIDLAACEQERRALLTGLRVDHRTRAAGPPKVLRQDRRKA